MGKSDVKREKGKEEEQMNKNLSLLVRVLYENKYKIWCKVQKEKPIKKITEIKTICIIKYTPK